MNIGPQSKLTSERPDIWLRAMSLATGLTGYSYPHKSPLPDGTISACGGGSYPPFRPLPDKPKSPEEVKQKKIDDLKRDRKNHRDWIDIGRRRIGEWEPEIANIRKEIEDREKTISDLTRQIEKLEASSVLVPEGAMEWLLHEVGHWAAATPEERAMPNYGYGTILCADDSVLVGLGADREWQAWAFEEIILAPFGSARLMAAPEHQGGVGYSKAGPMPDWALRQAERAIASNHIDVGQWRSVYGEWDKWVH